MKLLYNSYNDMSIDDYFALRDLMNKLKDEESDELMLNLIAFMTGTSVEEVQNVSMSEFIILSNEVQWILKPLKQGKSPLFININGKIYDIMLDMRKCTTQQYIDFTQYSRNKNIFYKECLSTIIIPSGHTYNVGYDPIEVSDLIGKHISIQTAENIYLAFAYASKKLYLRSLKSLMQDLMKKMRKTKKEGMTEKRIKTLRTIVQIKEQITFISGLDLLTQ